MQVLADRFNDLSYGTLFCLSVICNIIIVLSENCLKKQIGLLNHYPLQLLFPPHCGLGCIPKYKLYSTFWPNCFS